MKATLRGTEYRLTLSPMSANRLPKRSNGTVEVTVNGEPFTAPVTNNVSWAEAGKEIYYIWVLIDGKAYYLTLDYATSASTYTGEEIATAEGTASRADPARVTKDPVKEAARISNFKATWEARTAA